MVMISTLHTQLTSTQAALATEQCHSARQRDVLEKAMEQLARETYCMVVGREDKLISQHCVYGV